LPKVAPDPAFADKIYSALEAELRAKNRVNSFEKFCERIPLPDLEAKTLDEVKQQLVAGFGDVDLDIQPDEENKSLAWMSRCRTARNFTAGFPCARSRPRAATSRKSP
jgi:hypothetical protein